MEVVVVKKYIDGGKIDMGLMGERGCGLVFLEIN